MPFHRSYICVNLLWLWSWFIYKDFEIYAFSLFLCGDFCTRPFFYHLFVVFFYAYLLNSCQNKRRSCFLNFVYLFLLLALWSFWREYCLWSLCVENYVGYGTIFCFFLKLILVEGLVPSEPPIRVDFCQCHSPLWGCFTFGRVRNLYEGWHFRRCQSPLWGLTLLAASEPFIRVDVLGDVRSRYEGWCFWPR